MKPCKWRAETGENVIVSPVKRFISFDRLDLCHDFFLRPFAVGEVGRLLHVSEADKAS
jgi:hypothetical protein